MPSSAFGPAQECWRWFQRHEHPFPDARYGRTPQAAHLLAEATLITPDLHDVMLCSADFTMQDKYAERPHLRQSLRVVAVGVAHWVCGQPRAGW